MRTNGFNAAIPEGMREKAGRQPDHPKPLMQRGAEKIHDRVAECGDAALKPAREQMRVRFPPRSPHKPNKNNGTMKRLMEIIVAREEGFTSREWKMGGAFIAGMVVVCILAEIINAL